jgi:hypothetical protein
MKTYHTLLFFILINTFHNKLNAQDHFITEIREEGRQKYPYLSIFDTVMIQFTAPKRLFSSENAIRRGICHDSATYIFEKLSKKETYNKLKVESQNIPVFFEKTMENSVYLIDIFQKKDKKHTVLHSFVFETNEEGFVRIYQSFLDSYTLFYWLSPEGQPNEIMRDHLSLDEVENPDFFNKKENDIAEIKDQLGGGIFLEKKNFEEKFLKHFYAMFEIFLFPKEKRNQTDISVINDLSKKIFGSEIITENKKGIEDYLSSESYLIQVQSSQK